MMDIYILVKVGVWE